MGDYALLSHDFTLWSRLAPNYVMLLTVALFRSLLVQNSIAIRYVSVTVRSLRILRRGC